MEGEIKRNALLNFLNNKKTSPILAAIAAGLYPLLFYFSNNYSLVKTWEHVGYFVFSFLLVPSLGFLLAAKLFKISSLERWQKYILPFLNFLVFLFLLGVCHVGGVQKKVSLLALIIAIVATIFLYRHLKKVIIFQIILAIIGGLVLLKTIIDHPTYSETWLLQPDDIEEVVFKQKPNVYFIQPDGYTNFSELKKGYYDFENHEFEDFLGGNGFKNYDNFRSNYASTLSSNSSLFMMKHHYYNNGANHNEGFNGRKVILTKNSVLDIFANNGYKTHFLTEMPYLLLNKPKIGYDISNFKLSEVPYISTGLNEKKEIQNSFENYLSVNNESPKFFFIEIFSPGHIKNAKLKSKGKEGEREAWLVRLEASNVKLKEIVTSIKQKDPNGLIIISSDHGGYVGYDYANEIYVKTEDEAKVRSVFSSILSIHWPNEQAPDYDSRLKSSVNLFRVIFSYLSGDTKYLSNLETDSSYIIITEKASRGAYQYLDTDGKLNFKKYDVD